MICGPAWPDRADFRYSGYAVGGDGHADSAGTDSLAYLLDWYGPFVDVDHYAAFEPFEWVE